MAILSPLHCTRMLTRGQFLARRVLAPSQTIISPSVTSHHNNISRRYVHTTIAQREDETTEPVVEETSTLPIIPPRFNLTFEEYIQLKRKLKTQQRGAGAVIGLSSSFATSFVLSMYNPHWFIPVATPEEIPLVFGMDPMMVVAGATVVGFGFGYGVGGAFWKGVWSTLNRSKRADVDAREADFLKRLDRHRFIGDSKFEDDFYGDSIKNLSDYRQWVRLHQKKRETAEKMNLQNLAT